MTILQTKFGSVNIYDNYYVIISSKEGNKNKKLHRLIWEDFYNCKIPDGYIIHHKNGNKLDNCILNLQLMRESVHKKLHSVGENHPMYNKSHHIDTCKNMSKSHNNESIFRVGKCNSKSYSQGFYYRYRYYENGKQKAITSKDLKSLKKKVLSKGLEWEEF